MISDQQLRSMTRSQLEDLRRRTLTELVRRDREGEPTNIVLTSSATSEGNESQVLDSIPHADGHILLERRANTLKDGSINWTGPYYYFHHRSEGKRKKRYIGAASKIEDPLQALTEKRAREGW